MIHLESFIDAVVATLDAHVNEQIDVENAKHTDFALPHLDPGRVLFGGENPILKYPAIDVASPEIGMSGFSLGQQDWDIAPRVIVRGWLQNDVNIRGFEQLYRGCLRFGRVLLNTLVVSNAFGDNSTITTIRASYGVNPLANTREEFVSASVLDIALADFEVQG